MFFSELKPLFVYRQELPHWRQDDVWYFVTFRLFDSLPQEKLIPYRREREAWLQANPQPWSENQSLQYHRLFSKRMMQWLDAGYGSLALRQPQCREIVESALQFFGGLRYELDDYVVSGNHVHVLCKPLGGILLEDLQHSWKSYTAKKINKVLGRRGTFWQSEGFDHIVRNSASLEKIRAYITAHV